MKTNYNNLSLFEACAVVAMVVGLGLICFEIYTVLPQNQKVEVSSAFEVFDMHQELADSSIGFQNITGVMQNYYDQFDLAFTQIFSYPDEVGTPIIKFAVSLDQYSQSVAMAYEQNNVTRSQNAGQVLGAMFVKATSQVLESDTISSSSHSLQKQYYYHAPSVVQDLFK